jgi:Lactoylglutathione lyase and related lyases
MIRHTGIYVSSIKIVEEFYINTFAMYVICKEEQLISGLLDELLGERNVRVLITKLITDFGVKTGNGDMLELIEVISSAKTGWGGRNTERKIWKQGTAHIAFDVEDIEHTSEMVRRNGGIVKTKVYEMENKNKCCFCCDPEGNWIELIQKYV